MKKLIYTFTIFTSIVFFSSCEYFDTDGDGSLSTDEIVDGLKTALKIGTDSSSTALSAVDGYYGDALVQIPLPDELEAAEKVVETILKKKSSTLSTFLDQAGLNLNLFEDVKVGVNRAAESAATEAGPIFGESIDDLSIGDAWDILKGTNPADTSSTKSAGFDSTAATQYFKSTTKGALIDLYAPKIDHFLDEPLIKKKSGEAISANSAFNEVKTKYNQAYDLMATAAAVPILGSAVQTEMNNLGVKPITTPTIGTFCTDKALDGLFYKVGEEEKKIRRDPWAWVSSAIKAVSDLLIKVFG